MTTSLNLAQQKNHRVGDGSKQHLGMPMTWRSLSDGSQMFSPPPSSSVVAGGKAGKGVSWPGLGGQELSDRFRGTFSNLTPYLPSEPTFSHVSADPIWAASRTSGSLWQTGMWMLTAPVQCCGAPRRAGWQRCGMSPPRQGLCLRKVTCSSWTDSRSPSSPMFLSLAFLAKSLLLGYACFLVLVLSLRTEFFDKISFKLMLISTYLK